MEVKFETALRYPFNRPKGLLNGLWILVPIIGWFALGGYSIRIINEFIKGKFKKLPEMEFGSDLELGFMMFLKALPFIIAYSIVAYVLGYLGIVGRIITFALNLFIIPILGVNFVKKQTIESYFEFHVLTCVVDEIGDYLIALLKGIGLALIFGVLCIVLVGYPALMFTEAIFMADFYGRNA